MTSNELPRTGKQIVAANPIINLSGSFHPCTPEEVAELEREVGLKLPAAYKEFLLWSGKGLGVFEEGSRFFCDQDLVELQQIAQEFLVEDGFPQQLPNDAFVFWMHQGYMFTFFCTSEGNNPPVHFCVEPAEGEQPEIKWNYQAHFTDFLVTELKNHIRWEENSRQTEERIARDWTRA